MHNNPFSNPSLVLIRSIQKVSILINMKLKLERRKTLIGSMSLNFIFFCNVCFESKSIGMRDGVETLK